MSPDKTEAGKKIRAGFPHYTDQHSPSFFRRPVAVSTGLVIASLNFLLYFQRPGFGAFNSDFFRS
jgi:hypothetical protein